jgi:hypothetical protein
MGYLKLFYLIFKNLIIFQLFLVVDFQFNFIVIWEHTWHEFYYFKYVKVGLGIQNIVCIVNDPYEFEKNMYVFVTEWTLL